MEVLVINCGSEKTPYILEMLHEQELHLLNIEDDYKFALKKADAVVISGAPVMVSEDKNKELVQNFSWIRDFEKPILGICFGHQVLGMQYGASAFYCEEDRDTQEIEVVKRHILFENLPNPCAMDEDHCEAIDLPIGFERLGKSKIAENEAMAHITKPFLGVQFHPETSGENGRQLFKNFMKFCNAQ